MRPDRWGNGSCELVEAGEGSKETVHKAYKALEAEGLVTSTRGHGTVVRLRAALKRLGIARYELHRTTYTADGTVVEFAVGIHSASRFAWEYDFKVPDSAQDRKGQE